jgi:Uma2 family endonuclease
MAQPEHHVFTFADYLRLEGDSGVRHEFLNGAVWAMAGGTPEHAALAVNVSTLLNVALRGSPCRVYSSDLRVRIRSSGLATYPDVTVICGDPVIDPEDPKRQTVTNPRVVVEILSPSTEGYDRGKKLDHYKQCDSVEAILFVVHDRRQIDVWTRDPDGWVENVNSEGETAHVGALALDLPLDEVYRDLIPLGYGRREG